MKGDLCTVCLVPMARGSKLGICQRTPVCKAAFNAAWQLNHKGYSVIHSASWHREHQVEVAAYNVAYRAAHKEETAAYLETHKEERAAVNARRRTQTKVKMTTEDRALSVDYRKAIANDLCFYCKHPGEEVDHYVSLANGGTDHWWNLVRACVSCNRRKRSRNGDEFVVSRKEK